VEANGGVIISIDGIQPDKGNETFYLVRDVLTGRLLAAENVSSSETEAMKRVLSPVVNLGVAVLGVISDAQHTERLAVAQLWPEVPHQTCQVHYLREASQPIYEADRSMRTAMRKTIGNRLKKTRNQMARQLGKGQEQAELATQGEQEQLQVLADYALGISTALNLEGNQPFEYAGIAAFDALEEVEQSLRQLGKKGNQ
jgi:Transposase, Mutator family